MKIKGTLGIGLLLLAGWLYAEAEGSDQQMHWEGDSERAMTWPLMPKESLNDLARMFYPRNTAMQRQFVQNTLRMNQSTYPQLQADDRFNVLTPLQVPTLKSLSASRAAKRGGKSGLHMSMDLPVERKKVSLSLIRDYENLFARNEFLKAQIQKLHEKLAYLEQTLSELKLKLDKTLDYPPTPAPQSTSTTASAPTTLSTTAPATPAPAQPASSSATTPVAQPEPATASASSPMTVDVSQPAPDAVPISNQPTPAPQTASVTVTLEPINPANQPSQAPVAAKPPPVLPGGKLKNLGNKPLESSQPASTNSGWQNLQLLILPLLALLGFALSWWLKRYRNKVHEEMFKSSLQNTSADLPGFQKTWQDTQILDIDTPTTPNEGITLQEVQPESENYMANTLQEAKLLVSVGRNQEAIEYIKQTLKDYPKVSIHLWLYLLELFRKGNMQEDFENFAKAMHEHFNVMTPVWEERAVAMVVPQSLEDFPHIMEKLYSTWPSDLARQYLRSLITDNRDGDREGFGKAVLDEILMLIALLDTRKDIQ